jgi:hypothetical protein
MTFFKIFIVSCKFVKPYYATVPLKDGFLFLWLHADRCRRGGGYYGDGVSLPQHISSKVRVFQFIG